ncbi:cysteine hydrolase [Uliginosibacterium sp. 31-16]|uniref:cysteine hydrolase n=1 Tax=Uliginosibacterium sp. 31-16 TaxID=3068315 RepID=UPI00273E793D|nr:cysteine hydrolase [Uliginosibacterium sp. 31-16]MDP5240457.1 cysteine hydrolase [Uliginosibacterium sp. 31-16]
MAQRKLQLLIIDPQNDFCDLPEAYCPPLPTGAERMLPALPVSGAHADMLRLAALIDAGLAGLGDITVTLDSHQHLDIAHPTFWCDARGAAIAPFTQITAADARAGKYRPKLLQAQARVLAYLDALEAAGRYTHMVWPVHCEIGTWGHNIHHDLRLALNRWEEQCLAVVDKVSKGSNPWTEHFSAIMAEVPDPADASTQLNAGLIARLQSADRLYIAGEAGSHCVRATVEHLADNFASADLHKIVLIEDCISPVSGFAANQTDFFRAMQARGLQVLCAAEVITELHANAI